MSNMTIGFVLAFLLAVIAIFAAGTILGPTAGRTFEEQQKIVEMFSPRGISSEGSMTLKCTPSQGFYAYEADLSLSLSEPKDSEELPFVVIAFLDDNTFDLGLKSNGNSVINYPSETKVQLKFSFRSNEIKTSEFPHVTFWKFSTCVEKNVEKKDSFLDIVRACPEDYLYAGFFKIPNVDNSACLCSEVKNRNECEGKTLCYWKNSKCINCNFFDNCKDLNEDLCKGCRLARENCLWADRCYLNPSKAKGDVVFNTAEDIGGDLCEVHFTIRNSGSFDWTENERVKAIIGCPPGINELYIPPFDGMYIELANGQSIIDYGTLSHRNCPKTPQGEKWNIRLYINCDERQENCGPDAWTMGSLEFIC